MSCLKEYIFSLKNVKKMNKYIPTNREKSRKASKSKFWCNHCDAALVGEWGKCPVCRMKENKKKQKK